MVAERVFDVIERQDAATGIITAFVHEMYRNTAAYCTAVIEQRVDEGPDLSQSQDCAFLRKQTDAAFMDGPGEGKTERPTYTKRDRLRLCHTYHVGSREISGAVGLGRRQNHVMQHLDDTFRLLIVS